MSLRLAPVFVLGLCSVAAAAPDDDLSPSERFDKGIKTTGVFDVNDPAACSQAALKRIVGGGILPNDKVLGKNALGGEITAGGYAAQMRTILQQAMDQLKATGDTVVTEHHLCVGLGDFGETGPNAVAVKVGYIFADPRLTDLINALPDRTMFSLDMFWVHELSHHLQYWNGTPFEKDARDRRNELAADCAASALVAARWTEAFALKSAADGVVAAAVRVGDYDFEGKGHHGTPAERKAAATHGVQIVLDARTAGTKLPTSKLLLDDCNAYIQKRDKATGPNWKD